MSSRRSPSARRRRLLIRALPLAAVALAAFVVGASVASKSPELDATKAFAAAWAAGDYAGMHARLAEDSQAEYPVAALERAYESTAATATIERIAVGKAEGPKDQEGRKVVVLPVTITTAAFGEIAGEIALPVAEGGVIWDPSLTFPGLRAGERLRSELRLGNRGPLLDKDREPLAEGPAGARSVTPAAVGFVGTTGMPEGELAEQLVASGYPKNTLAGLDGLELAFNSTLAGQPGGRLLAVGDGERRALAQSEPVDGKPVRTTIDLELQEATVAALGDVYGGAAVLDARTGNVRALAGVAFSAPQPPGSTFKVITTVAALNAGVTEPREEFPVETSRFVDGYEVSNAHGGACGGNLVTSFANSCNTVFAPLGVRVGGKRLHETAESFGFNQFPSLYSAESLALTKPPMSTIPEDFESELDVGISAIGQGRVLATPLSMASVAQAIANKGRRSPTSIVQDEALAGDYEEVVVAEPAVAKEVRKMMVEVVNSGTGGAAALPDVQVAGKTGTAELGTSSGEPAEGEEPELDVNAWFTAFAPAKQPKLAVAVMIINASGDGGTVAAPIAQQILSTGLAG